ncbi:alkaline phosphatase family protein [Nocardioides gilvus]|uniref:alkaline phosphatase family protein n=1 Tax=Nocardioides gilvus TaxID=1735589 RepID=UPI0013A52E6B|nr:alkaline phosphatase family protein [Nocardioides gilvus]
MKTRLHTPALLTVLAVGLLVIGLTSLSPWSPSDLIDEDPSSSAPTERGAAAERSPSTRVKPVESVLLISIDGLNPSALEQLGRKKTPHLHRLMRQGASTLNARTAVEETVTLPNHTSMVTGRRVDRAQGGHGIAWNKLSGKPGTVRGAARGRIDSVFSVVDKADGSSAMFVQKKKFRLWSRSWPKALDLVRVDENTKRLVRSLRKDLRERDREVRFLHLWSPDAAGHEHGFMSKRYLAAVRRADTRVGEVMKTVKGHPEVKGRLTVVLTSDHGGQDMNHGDTDVLANYRVPFMVRGPGVARNADLYDLSDALADPGRTQPSYDAEKPPVRNGDAANVVLGLLGLDPVPGSEFNAGGEIRLAR